MNTYMGKQRADPTAADRLDHTSVGWKEETGCTENNDRFVQRRDNPARFITHYQTRYSQNFYIEPLYILLKSTAHLKKILVQLSNKMNRSLSLKLE